MDGPQSVLKPLGSNGGDHPLAIYQSGAWNEFKIKAGTVNSQNVIGDDSDPIPLTITVPAGTTSYKIWIECVVDVTEGATQGTISDPEIMDGSTGWSGYPDQPLGDGDTGAPPNRFYILIGTVTTGATESEGATISQALTSSLQVDMVGYNITCNSTLGFILLKRMSSHRT